MNAGTPRFRIDEAKAGNLIGRLLEEARVTAGMSLTDLSRALSPYGLDISKSGLSRWENGDRTPSAYQMMALCEVLSIPNPLDMYAEEELPEPVSFAEYVDVRLYRVAVSAGPGSFLDGDDFELLRVPRASVPSGTDYALRVSGNSMEPAYRDGQIVWVRAARSLRPGEVGVFSLDGESLLKQYDERVPEDAEDYLDAENILHRQPVLRSFNPAYAPRPVRPESYFQILGRVLG